MVRQPLLAIANSEEWEKMALVEVIVTKKCPRRLFPTLQFTATDLDPEKSYTASVVLERADGFMYSYKDGKWSPRSHSTTERVRQTLVHKEGVKTGKEWMESGIDFSFIVFSIDVVTDPTKTFMVETMHRYQPILVLAAGASGDETLMLLEPKLQFVITTTLTVRFKKARDAIKTEKMILRKPVAKRRLAVKAAVEEGPSEEVRSDYQPPYDDGMDYECAADYQPQMDYYCQYNAQGELVGPPVMQPGNQGQPTDQNNGYGRPAGQGAQYYSIEDYFHND